LFGGGEGGEAAGGRCGSGRADSSALVQRDMGGGSWLKKRTGGCGKGRLDAESMAGVADTDRERRCTTE
jgi:hypothetical protein